MKQKSSSRTFMNAIFSRTPRTLVVVGLFLLTMLPTLVLTPRLFLNDPPIWPDEAYFVDLAQNYNASGHIFTSLYGNTFASSPHIRAYNYPPLYIYSLAVWMRLFGSSITVVRFFSVIIGVTSLLVFFVLLRQMSHSTVLSVVGTLSLELFNPFIGGMHIARMEILIFLFLLSSLVFLHSSNRQKKLLPFEIACVFGTLAFLSHPIGIIVLAVIFLFLLFSESSYVIKFQRLLLLAATLGLGLIWWLWQVHDRLDLFLAQTQTLYAYKVAREPLLNLLFQNDLFWRLLLLFYLVLGSLGCIIGVQRRNRLLLISGLGTFSMFLFILWGVDQWYFLFLSVFPILFSLLWIKEFFVRTKRISWMAFLPLLLLLLFHAIGSSIDLTHYFHGHDNYFTFAKQISKEIPSHQTLLISAIPDPFFILKERSDLQFRQVPLSATSAEFEAYMATIDIIIYNYSLNSKLPPYLATHTSKKITVDQKNGYQAEIIFLKK